MVLVIGLLFVINWLSFEYISKSIIYFKDTGVVVKLIEATLRTVILVVIGLAIIYRLKISKEINEIINKVCHFDRP